MKDIVGIDKSNETAPSGSFDCGITGSPDAAVRQGEDTGAGTPGYIRCRIGRAVVGYKSTYIRIALSGD